MYLAGHYPLNVDENDADGEEDDDDDDDDMSICKWKDKDNVKWMYSPKLMWAYFESCQSLSNNLSYDLDNNN